MNNSCNSFPASYQHFNYKGLVVKVTKECRQLSVRTHVEIHKQYYTLCRKIPKPDHSSAYHQEELQT